MAKKFYAVREGHQIGIFTDWSECQRQVSGYSGAVFKSFATLTQAEEYLNPDTLSNTTKNISEAQAYVDGSYSADLNAFSYGVVMFYDGEQETFSEKFEGEGMRNVSGEIKGAEKAMQYCVDNGIKSIDIYHDYEGIEKWCTGDWQAKKPETRAYKSYYNSIQNTVTVNFIKVAAHSGDFYNDLADKLAKEALAG